HTIVRYTREFCSPRQRCRQFYRFDRRSSEGNLSGARLPQIFRIGAFLKPIVDWCDEASRLTKPSLLFPKRGEAGRRSQFQGFGLLTARQLKSLLEARLGLAGLCLVQRKQQLAFLTKQFTFPRSASRISH